MSTRTITHDLWGNISCVSEKPASSNFEQVCLPNVAQCKFLGLQYIALDQVVEVCAEKDNGKGRFNLEDILFTVKDIFFPDHERETYRRLEGEDMTPIAVYQSGNQYLVTDGGQRLAVARYLGQAYILAEVWELPYPTAP
ncbi:MAG TPA: hypothetical protein PKH77_13600 [Anaerolineae bacterium]|nr:hypothetical protein [Anaerolineae bacterium]